jgi:hypothetical protein
MISSGRTHVVAVAPIASVAYAATELIGEKLTISDPLHFGGGRGRIVSVTLADKAKQNSNIDVVFFNADPSATTFTDGSPLVVADADLLRILGVVPIVAADYVDFSASSVASVRNVNLGIELLGTTKDLYCCLVSDGTPTYAAVADLQLMVHIAQYS